MCFEFLSLLSGAVLAIKTYLHTGISKDDAWTKTRLNYYLTPEMTEENADEKYEEEYDMTEQAPVLPHQGVCKRGQPMSQSDTSVHQQQCRSQF
jgi:hypothetical protein